jgi:hypothetical protein
MKKLTTVTYISIAIIILLIAGGSYYMFGHGLLSKKPMLYGTDVPDGIVKGFLERTIPHNIESVEASKKIMVDVDITIPEVRLLAARIADAQEFEIGQMRGWYTEWFGIPVPLFLYKPTFTPITGTGDEVAKVYLKDMIRHYQDDVDEAMKARAYIEVMQKKNSSSDGQLTITNSHPGIDTTLIFTETLEEKRQKDIGDMQDLLKKL